MAYIVVKALRYLYLSVHLFIWVRYIPASKHVCFKEHPLVDGKWIFLSVHIWHFKWSPFRYHVPSGSNKLTPYVLIFQREEKHISTIYVIRPHWLGTGSWNPVPDNNLPILRCQYNGYWCPGEARSQGISSNGIQYVEPNLFGLRTFRVKRQRP